MHMRNPLFSPAALAAASMALVWAASEASPIPRRIDASLPSLVTFVPLQTATPTRTPTRTPTPVTLVTRTLVTIRRKLAALSSLFEYLCEANAVTHNPVKGVKRPKVESQEGKTPTLGDHQARQLLQAVGYANEEGSKGKEVTVEAGKVVDVGVINKVFRAVHSIKGAAGFLGLTRIGELAHSAENVLSLIRSGELVPNNVIVEASKAAWENCPVKTTLDE